MWEFSDSTIVLAPIFIVIAVFVFIVKKIRDRYDPDDWE